MNTEIMTALQTQLAEIGRKNKFAPPKSQDPADAIAHEFLVADVARSLMQKRYSAAKIAMEDLIGVDALEKIIKQTELTNASVTEEVLRTENYGCTVKINSPSAGKVDAKMLMNELTRLGVDRAIIDKAAGSAMTYSKAATYISVVPVRSRD